MIVRDVHLSSKRIFHESRDVDSIEILSNGSYRTIHSDGCRRLHEPVSGFKIVVINERGKL